MWSKKIVWWVILGACLAPGLVLMCLYWLDPRRLGVDPTEVVIQQSGLWAMRFLVFTLACSSFKRFGIKFLSRYRRMLGLTVFGYASLHLATYLAGWLQWDMAIFVEDVTTRPFIYLGMIAWLFLLVLALTSPNRMKKYLKLNWVRLHRVTYLVVLLVWIHLWMQSRASLFDAVLYGLLFALLFLERAYRIISKRRLA